MTLSLAAIAVAVFLNVTGLQSAEARAEAERLARSGAHARALAAFQRIVAADPADLEARMWIGRLHLWMGHPRLARGVFDSVLAGNPDHVEALVGAGMAAMNDGRPGEAEAPLAHALQLAPDSAEVLAALGRLHRLGGRLTLALAYYDRAVQQNAADREIRDARDAVFAQRAHRVEAGYAFEHFDIDVPDTHAGTLEINARLDDRLRVFGRGQDQRKFGRTEARAGGGLEWDPGKHVHIRGGALVAEPDALVLPRADAAVDLEAGRRRVTWLFSGRYLHFSASNVGIGSIGLAWSASDRTVVTVRYYRSETAFEGFDERAGNNAGSVQLGYRASRRLWLSGSYARGYESFETVTADRLTERGADTVSAGATVSFGPQFALAPAFVFERRDDTTHVASAYVTLIGRF